MNGLCRNGFKLFLYSLFYFPGNFMTERKQVIYMESLSSKNLLHLALCSLDIIWEDKDRNRENCEKAIQAAAGRGVDLILFPEMTLTGFSMDVGKIADRQKETIRFFQDMAKKYGIAAGFGYVTEKENKRGENHFCIVAKDRTIRSDYVKIHPFTYGGEDRYYDGGDALGVCQMEGFVCGTFICYDLRFPELFQCLPDPVDAVFVIANWPGKRVSQWKCLLQARAIELQCYAVGVNRTGEGGGLCYEESSTVYAPDGTEVTGECDRWNHYVTLDRARVEDYRKNFPVLCDRREQLYAGLRGTQEVLKERFKEI